MKYRAKITCIRAWVEDHYNLNAFTIVKDVKDAYIEVDDLDEADLLESMNKLENQMRAKKKEWYEKYYRE